MTLYLIVIPVKQFKVLFVKKERYDE